MELSYYVKTFVDGLLELGFWNTAFLAFVMLLLREAVNYVAKQLETVFGMEHKLYIYDAGIMIGFILLFVYVVFLRGVYK